MNRPREFPSILPSFILDRLFVEWPPPSANVACSCIGTRAIRPVREKFWGWGPIRGGPIQGISKDGAWAHPRNLQGWARRPLPPTCHARVLAHERFGPSERTFLGWGPIRGGPIQGVSRDGACAHPRNLQGRARGPSKESPWNDRPRKVLGMTRPVQEFPE